MQSAQDWRFSMRRGGWNGKPCRGVWQIDHLSEVEFGVVAEPRRRPGCWIAVAQDREFAAVQLRRALTGAVTKSTGVDFLLSLDLIPLMPRRRGASRQIPAPALATRESASAAVTIEISRNALSASRSSSPETIKST